MDSSMVGTSTRVVRGDPSMWKLLWKLRMPEKVKVFVWRAIHDILPTYNKLRSKKMVVEPKCKLCDTEDETALHCLKNCTLVQQVWQLSSVGLRSSTLDAGTVEEWIRNAASEYDREQLTMFCITACSVWIGIWIFEQEAFVLAVVARKAEYLIADCLRECKEATAFRAAARRSDDERWNPPLVGTVKVNTNGAIFGGDVGGGGIIIRDHEGKMLAGMWKRFDPVLDVESVEALAIIEGMGLAMRRGFRSIIIESDCTNLTHRLNSSKVRLDASEILVRDIKDCVTNFSNCVFNYVSRNANSTAPALTRAVFVADSSEWGEAPLNPSLTFSISK